MKTPTKQKALMSFQALLLCSSILAGTATEANDPTQPAGWQAPKQKRLVVQPKRKPKPSEAPQVLRLQGVVINSLQKIALINNRWLTVNETLGKATVLQIEPGRVTLKRAGRTFALKVIDQTVAQKAADSLTLPSREISTAPTAPSTGFVTHPAGHPHGR